MASGEEWLLRPVYRGMCQYVDLINTNLDLSDVARLNDFLDVLDENEYRYNKAEN